MQESLLIKYSYDSRDGFDLGAIGESFMGFDAVLKELLDIAQLGESVQIKTSKVQQGSIEVINAVVLIDVMPFHNVESFLEFLRIAAPEALNSANTFFSGLADGHRSVNDYFAQNPVDQTVAERIVELIVVYIVSSLAVSRKLKKSQSIPVDSKASDRQIKRLKRMISTGKYKRALKPITEGSASSIKVATLSTKQNRSVTISEANVGDYLPDDSMILPEYENGQEVRLTGELQSLQSTHGDTMKIRVDNIDPKNSLLVATPSDGVNIEDYAGYFKKQVIFDAEIFRKTMYKRPELIIHSMSLAQTQLLDDEETQ